MTILDKFLARIRAQAPVISTPWGQVTESARFTAAMNMLADPAIKFRVEEIIIKECGGDRVRGLAECKRRYPEAYPKG